VGFVEDKVALGQISPSTSVSSANHHSTNFSIIIITRGWHNRPAGGRSAEWTQLDSTPNYTNVKNIKIDNLCVCVTSSRLKAEIVDPEKTAIDMQWFGKRVSTAINTHARTDKLLCGVFSMRSVPYRILCRERPNFTTMQPFQRHKN
jgi:hypothetical protein